MNIVESTYQSIYNDASTKNPEVFIEVIERNWKQIDNLKPETSNQLYCKTRLTSDYGIMLFKANRFHDALSVIEKAVKMFEEQTDNPFKESLYETLVANRGLCNQQLKNESEAKKDFKLLHNRFRENSRYRDWLAGVKLKRLHRFDNIFTVLILIGVICAVFFDRNAGVLNYSYLLFIIAGLTGSAYIYIRKNKIKQAE